MKIYIIEDKREENKKAEEIIIGSGNEIGTIKTLGYRDGIMRLGEASSISDAYHRQLDAQIEVSRKVYEAKKNDGGIITDMMFNLTSPLTENDPIAPSGLLVIIQALAAGVPVVVCTNADEVGGHHAQAMHWFCDGYIFPTMRSERKSLPFGWIENKDWDAAVKLLEQIHAQQKEKGGDK
jgi:hypothetical protein